MTTDGCVCFYESESPCPFCAEENRDLHADLALCNAATVGPWIYSDWPGSVNVVTPGRRIIAGVYGMDAHEANARGTFIAAARTGWPHAIDRALAAERKLAEAEADVARLREALTNIVEIEDDFYTEEVGVGQRRLPTELRSFAGSLSVLFREANLALKEATADDTRT